MLVVLEHRARKTSNPATYTLRQLFSRYKRVRSVRPMRSHGKCCQLRLLQVTLLTKKAVEVFYSLRFDLEVPLSSA